ncbi:MAG: hypothetical protein DRI57_05305 [Deltaproteobacteria bacterium]|nr:MAG: hypothetical protein DRI57_05305 [Deltaproteobacteria bacterium]
MPIKLHDFQQEVVNKFFKSGSLLCVLPTGTGKTVVALEIIRRLKEQYGNKTKCLIVVPANLRSNFVDTIRKFQLKLNAEIIQKVSQLDQAYRTKTILVISYDFMRLYALKLLRYKWTLIVADEVHYAKNRQTKNFAVLYQLRLNSRHFLGLTASPIANTPEEFFTILIIVTGDRSIFAEGMQLIKYMEIGRKDPTWWEKLKATLTGRRPRSKKGELIPIGIKDIEAFRRLVGRWVYIPHYSKIEKLGTRPKVKSFVVRVDLDDFETKAYKYALRKIPRQDLKDLKEGTITNARLRQIKNIIMACQQTLLSPDYIYEYEERGQEGVEQSNISLFRPGSKIKAVAKFLKQTGEKTIVFSSFLRFGARLANHYFNKLGIKSREYSGAVKPQERKEIIKQFEEGDLQVICLTGAGQEGMNLPSCKNVFFLNLPWHGEILRQVVGRALRITSKNPFVRMFWLFAYTKDGQETIDLWLSNLIKRKDIIRNAIFAALQETTANVSVQLPSYEGPRPKSKRKPDTVLGINYPR